MCVNAAASYTSLMYKTLLSMPSYVEAYLAARNTYNEYRNRYMPYIGDPRCGWLEAEKAQLHRLEITMGCKYNSLQQHCEEVEEAIEALKALNGQFHLNLKAAIAWAERVYMPIAQRFRR